MNTEKLINIQKLYDKPMFLMEQKILNGDEYNFNIYFVLLSLIILFIYYIKINVTIDIKNWDLKKCNPKYLFFSGYIKNDTKYSNGEATIKNFAECTNKLVQGATQYELGKKIGNGMNNFKDYMTESNQYLMKNNKTYLDKLKERQNDITSQFDELNKDVSFNLDEENTGIYSLLKNTGIYMDQLNELMEYIRKNSHQYLTYKMVEYYNTCSSQGCHTENINYKKYIEIKNLLNKYYGGSTL